jgi:disulfide bond formation protein DsbB
VNDLLEIYKLHAELADRVSQRRIEASKIFVSILLGILALLGLALRFGVGNVPDQGVFGIAGILGIALTISWLGVIHSHKQLNRVKFRILHKLEEKLPFQFFKDEWDPDNTGSKSNAYWKLTDVEKLMPLVFLLLFVGIAVYGICFT